MDENTEEPVKPKEDAHSDGLNPAKHPSGWEEMLGAWPLDWEGDGKPAGVWTRLGFLIPAAPWPVLLWFKAQGWQHYGRHGVEALYFVRSEAVAAIVVCTVAGVVCHIADYRDRRRFLRALFILTIHFYVIYSFLDANAVAYA